MKTSVCVRARAPDSARTHSISFSVCARASLCVGLSVDGTDDDGILRGENC